MTTLLHDINKHNKEIQENRIAVFLADEYLYADDTILVSQSASALTSLLQIIEEEGEKVGLVLKNKCELLVVGEGGKFKKWGCS